MLQVQNLTKSYANIPLFQDLDISVNPDDRIALIGPNGVGKSSLLKIISGQLHYDSGNITRTKNLRVAYAKQNHDFNPEDTIVEAILRMNQEYLEEMGEELSITEINKAISQIGFDANNDIKVGKLSGGWQKRLLLAGQICLKPDLLLLDEPTNHLDFDTILWLENFLIKSDFGFMMVSHDRAMIENCCNRIIEINPVFQNGSFSFNGKYSSFLEKKEEYLDSQEKNRLSLKNKVTREVEWLRKGPKARTTKAKYRVDQAHALKDELSSLENRLKSQDLEIQFTESGRKTRRLVKIHNLGKSYPGAELFQQFSYDIKKGMKIGLVGKNGSGKSTLLKILAGEIEADEGYIQTAEFLKIAYFDQAKSVPDENQSVRDFICDEGDYVFQKGEKVHVITYLSRFLFNKHLISQPINRLSGGQRSRLLMAKMILSEADLLFLDEPTNDLDLMTLELLERNLSDFQGTLVLVSHDRFFVDQICNIILDIEGDEENRLFADIFQWLDYRKGLEKQKKKEKEPAIKVKKEKKRKGLTYNDQRELSLIEETMESEEEKLEALQQKAASESMNLSPNQLNELYSELQAQQDKVDQMYERWQELESLKAGE